MTLNITVPQQTMNLQPRITVIGVGGAGGNAVNNMILSHLEGVEFLVANTDAQALAQSQAERRIQLGLNITNGLGAGSRPDIGRAAAEEAIDELVEHLQSAHMVFVTAGMGGGTGTGAAPVIARLAREHGILTVGVVTKPFQFEGANRMRIADAGIEEMQQYVDTLIVIPNQNLFRVANEKTTFAEAFSMADEVLHSGVRGVTDLMVVPGLINLDFADIRTVMAEMGKAMMGTGESDGEDRARMAAEAAISNPLLDEVSMKGARGVLINITGGTDMTLFEVDEAANRIGDEVDSDANIIFGSTMDPSLEGRLRVSVVATGIDAAAAAKPRPVLRVYTCNQSPDPVAEEGGAAASEDLPAAEVRGSLGIPSVSSYSRHDSEAGRGGANADLDADFGRDRGESRMQAPSVESPMSGASSDTAGIPRPPEVAMPARAEAGPAIATATAAAQAVFVPPPAVEPARSVEPLVEPDPFRAAEMINAAAPQPSRKRGPSLFQRMTGGGKSRNAEPQSHPRAPVVEADSPEFETPSSDEVKIMPKLDAAAPEIQTDSPVPAPEPQPVQQPRLDDVAHRETLGVSQAEEDLLDIPAFLRRQAN